MVVYSRYPIDSELVRTFQRFLWKDMPGARLPDDPATPQPADWYSPQEQDVFRLSSKSHWDVPIDVDGQTVHFLVSHPTPPVFDGDEDRNGTRNADEIRFTADYVTPSRGRYIYDDEGRRGGLDPGALFVIAGDQNSDPLDGDSLPGAAQQLLENPRINARHARRRAPARPRPPRCRAARTRPTGAIRSSTPPISPTARPATCAPTTCCRAATSGSPARPSSGPSRPIRCSGSRACSTP